MSELPLSPDFSRGYLRVPLAVWATVYCRAPLTRRQLQLVSVVIRESWGWRAPDGSVYLWTRPLTPRRFADITGLTTDRLARDLRYLVGAGVLQEDHHRYRFVPHRSLWKTAPLRTPFPLGAPAEAARFTAEVTASTPELKKEQKRERDVPDRADADLSPAGDKPPASPVERLVALVTLLAGVLTEAQERGLRRWVRHAGIGRVWRELEPSLRGEPADLRHRLDRLPGAGQALDRPAPSRDASLREASDE